MADPKEPTPSAPPREPTDVPIFPDDPPREPFDVPIFPDGPPVEPFDVPINPDGPPFETFDVATSPDRAPLAPFDVPVAPDAPPADPFDVPLNPDLPPRAPFDVPTDPDLGPAVPFDVPTTPDGPPLVPFDVAVAPDGPPLVPFQVQVTPDSPPAVPFDVPTTPDQQIGIDNVWIGPTPALGDAENVQISKDAFNPAAVPSNQNPGVPALPYPLPSLPTIEGIIEVVKDYDHQLATFLSDIMDVDITYVSRAGGGALDPNILAGWFKDWISTVGATGLEKFVAEQAVLYAMNPVVARVFNPAYFILMSIPGSMGHIPTTVDVAGGLTLERVAQGRDAFLQAQVATGFGRPAGDGSSDVLDVYGPQNKYSDGQAYSVDTLVDAALGDSYSPFVKTGAPGPNGSVTRFDANAFFENRDSAGAMLSRATARLRAASSVENVSNSKLAASVAIDGIIRTSIPNEELNGSVISTTQDPSEVIDDDDARVPLSFTDLRQVPGQKFRSVYFRPENLSFNESISPEFSEANAFGRVDSTVGYQKTSRNINLSFEVHAFAPEDIKTMYNKLNWLKSMCYPSYGADSIMESGPVVRMRIGDVISTDLGGVPGVIKSLSIDFSESMWELKRGMKVPMSFKVTLDFLVLHDGPVGMVNGVFGVYQLPPGGQAPDKDTSKAGNPSDSKEGTATSVTLLPGRFARFGEPRS